MSICTGCGETTRNRKKKGYVGILCKACRYVADAERRKTAKCWYPQPPGTPSFWQEWVDQGSNLNELISGRIPWVNNTPLVTIEETDPPWVQNYRKRKGRSPRFYHWRRRKV